jgi:hypothetical protein
MRIMSVSVVASDNKKDAMIAPSNASAATGFKSAKPQGIAKAGLAWAKRSGRTRLSCSGTSALINRRPFAAQRQGARKAIEAAQNVPGVQQRGRALIRVGSAPELLTDDARREREQRNDHQEK